MSAIVFSVSTKAAMELAADVNARHPIDALNHLKGMQSNLKAQIDNLNKNMKLTPEGLKEWSGKRMVLGSDLVNCESAIAKIQNSVVGSYLMTLAK